MDAEVIGHQHGRPGGNGSTEKAKSPGRLAPARGSMVFTAPLEITCSGFEQHAMVTLSAAKDKLALIQLLSQLNMTPLSTLRQRWRPRCLVGERMLRNDPAAQDPAPAHWLNLWRYLATRAKVGQHLKQSTEVEQQLNTILNGKLIIDLSEQGLVLAEAQIWQAERLWKSDNAAARQLPVPFMLLEQHRPEPQLSCGPLHSKK